MSPRFLRFDSTTRASHGSLAGVRVEVGPEGKILSVKRQCEDVSGDDIVRLDGKAELNNEFFFDKKICDKWS